MRAAILVIALHSALLSAVPAPAAEKPPSRADRIAHPPAPVVPVTGDPVAEAEIRALIARWYTELAKAGEGRVHPLLAPGAIDASPHIAYAQTGSAALGRPMYSALAARALRFAYDIDTIRIDPNFAKAGVWERGYFYAFAAQATYESAKDTDFVFERGKDGRWAILAHKSGSYGIPPNKVTSPMPDLRELYYATDGSNRDPEADAREGKKF